MDVITSDMNWINNAIKLADERILSPNFVNNFDEEDPSQKIFSIDQIDEWKIRERFYRDIKIWGETVP